MGDQNCEIRWEMPSFPVQMSLRDAGRGTPSLCRSSTLCPGYRLSHTHPSPIPPIPFSSRDSTSTKSSVSETFSCF